MNLLNCLMSPTSEHTDERVRDIAKHIRTHLEKSGGSFMSTTDLVKELLGESYDLNTVKTKMFNLLSKLVSLDLVSDLYTLGKPRAIERYGKRRMITPKFWHASKGEAVITLETCAHCGHEAKVTTFKEREYI